MQQVLLFKTYALLAAIGIMFVVAWWKGSGPERAAASILVGMFVVDQVQHALFGSGLFVHRINIGHFVIDFVATCLAVWLALTANRIFTLCFAGFQLAALLSHLVRGISDAPLKNPYAILIAAPSYFQAAALALGLAFHIRRRSRPGPRPSWHPSSNRSPEPRPGPTPPPY